MKYLIVLALIAFCAVNADPHAQNSPSDQQQQQLAMMVEQRLQEAGFDVSQLPRDSNGNLDLSKLPRDSNGNIELSQVVNGGGGSNGGGNGGGGNGGGSITVNGGGSGGSNGGGNGGSIGGGNGDTGGGSGGGFDPSNLSDQQKQQLSMVLEQRLQQAGFDVSQLPRDSNGNIDFSKLPRNANGDIELSQIINGGSGPSGGSPNGPGGSPNLPGGSPNGPGGSPNGPGGRPNGPGGSPNGPGGSPNGPGGSPNGPRGGPNGPNRGGPNGGGNISFNIKNLPSSGSININQIPGGLVSNGKLNLGPLNIGLSGSLDLSPIVGPNGDIPLLQLKLLLLRKLLDQLPNSGTININDIPAINDNGKFDLSKLPLGLNGTLDLSSIIGPNGDIPIAQLKQQILLQIMNILPSGSFSLKGKPNNATINVSTLPGVTNGMLNLNALGITGLNGTIDISGIIGANGQIQVGRLRGLIRKALKGNLEKAEKEGGKPGGGQGLTYDQLCHRGFIEGLKDAFENGFIEAASDAQSLLRLVFGKTPLKKLAETINLAIGDGFKVLTRNTGRVISDAACGLGGIAEIAATNLNKGTIFHGVKEILRRFLYGVLKSILPDATKGVGKTLKEIVHGLKHLGKK